MRALWHLAIAISPVLNTQQASDNASTYGIDPRPVPMRVEVILDSPTCVTFENVTLTVRIVNPNPFRVILRGFEFGYIEPALDVAGSDGEFRRIHSVSSGSAWRKQKVVIPGNDALELHRFLYGSLFPKRWPQEPGVYSIRAVSHLTHTGGDPYKPERPIEWESRPAELKVFDASKKDLELSDFIKHRSSDIQEAWRRNPAESLAVWYSRCYRDALHRFGTSTYAPELRWQLAKKMHSALAARGETVRFFG